MRGGDDVFKEYVTSRDTKIVEIIINNFIIVVLLLLLLFLLLLLLLLLLMRLCFRICLTRISLHGGHLLILFNIVLFGSLYADYRVLAGGLFDAILFGCI